MIKTAKVVESIQDNGGFIRTDEVAGRAEYEHIRKAIEDGTLVRVRQGVYAEQLALANTMIDVEKIVPGGVVCLYSAWSHYQLSTQIPSGHCIAIDSKRKVTIPEFPPINLYYWKKEYLNIGVTEMEICGYRVKITDVERSVCDAVKYRNKIGLDVCSEIINEYLKRKDRNISRLCEYAKQLRVYNTLSKYLEIVL